MDNDFKWYVVKVIANYEKKVKHDLEEIVESRNLQNIINEVFIAEYQEPQMDKNNKQKKDKAGHLKFSTRNYYTQYVFIHAKLDNNTWALIRNIRGVTGYCGTTKNDAIPISDEEMESIKKLCGIDIESEHIKKLLNYINKPVTITSGPFEGFAATLISINASTKKANLLYNNIPVEIDTSSVLAE